MLIAAGCGDATSASRDDEGVVATTSSESGENIVATVKRVLGK